jgi:CheY-like chemotaxis protein
MDSRSPDASMQSVPDTPSTGSHPSAVLIVDDEPALRDFVARVVESINCRAIQARDGAEGLQVFQNHRAEIGAIISDVNMPLMNGFEFIRAVRAIEPSVKVVLSSGSLVAEDQRVASTLGVTAVLPKPYTAGQLAACIRAVLEIDRLDRS